MLSLALTAPVHPTLRIIAVNAAAHFRLRASSWMMAVINLAVGLVLTINPGAMTDNPGAPVYFAWLLTIAPPAFWRALFLVIGFARLIALTINGTFPRFRHSPHIRGVLSTISAVVWAQMALSVAMTGLLSIGAVLFVAVVFVEIFNTGVAASDSKTRLEGNYG